MKDSSFDMPTVYTKEGCCFRGDGSFLRSRDFCPPHLDYIFGEYDSLAGRREMRAIQRGKCSFFTIENYIIISFFQTTFYFSGI
jgi:hypothetical protein